MKKDINQFTKDNIRGLLRPALELAMQDVEHAFNLKASVGRVRFTSTSMSVTIDLAVVNSHGVAETAERTAFLQLATTYGLTPACLGMEFEFQGDTYTIIGLNTKAARMPIQATRSDGKQFRFPVSTVKSRLSEGRVLKHSIKTLREQAGL